MRNFCYLITSICSYGNKGKVYATNNSGLEYIDKSFYIDLINKKFKDYSDHISIEDTSIGLYFKKFDDIWKFFISNSSSNYFKDFRFSFIEKKNNRILVIYNQYYLEKIKFKENNKVDFYKICFYFKDEKEKLSFKEILSSLDYKQFIEFLNDNNIVKKSIEIL